MAVNEPNRTRMATPIGSSRSRPASRACSSASRVEVRPSRVSARSRRVIRWAPWAMISRPGAGARAPRRVTTCPASATLHARRVPAEDIIDEVRSGRRRRRASRARTVAFCNTVSWRSGRLRGEQGSGRRPVGSRYRAGGLLRAGGPTCAEPSRCQRHRNRPATKLANRTSRRETADGLPRSRGSWSGRPGTGCCCRSSTVG